MPGSSRRSPRSPSGRCRANWISPARSTSGSPCSRAWTQRVIDRCLAERIRPNPGAATLVRTMRAEGRETILVSGGFTAFVAPIAEADRVRPVRSQCPWRSRRQADRNDRRAGSSIPGVKHDALVEARDRLGLVAERDAGDRRRRQRHPDGRGGGAWRRLSRQAGAGRGCRRAARPSWARRIAVGAGHSRAANGSRPSAPRPGSRAGAPAGRRPRTPRRGFRTARPAAGRPRRPGHNRPGCPPSLPDSLPNRPRPTCAGRRRRAGSASCRSLRRRLWRSGWRGGRLAGGSLAQLWRCRLWRRGLAVGGAAVALAVFASAIAWASATPFWRCSSGMTASMSARVALAGASPCAAARLT